MVLDAAGPNFGQSLSSQSYGNTKPESCHHFESSMEEEPNSESQRFYNLLQAADAELYPGIQIRVLDKAIENGRDPTPSELHLHVHTHGHDEKSFISERARIVHEKYQEILQNQKETQCDVDRLQAYYQAAGGEKKRIYGLRSQAKLFYGPNFHASSGSSASVSVPSSNDQIASTNNLDELVARLIPSLTNHMFPALVERVRELISSPSTQPNTSTDEHLTTMGPPISTPATVNNLIEVNASNSDASHGSPVYH